MTSNFSLLRKQHKLEKSHAHSGTKLKQAILFLLLTVCNQSNQRSFYGRQSYCFYSKHTQILYINTNYANYQHLLYTWEPRTITRSLGYFGAILCLCFKTSPSAKLSFKDVFDLHENKLVGGQWFRLSLVLTQRKKTSREFSYCLFSLTCYTISHNPNKAKCWHGSRW